MNNFLTAKSLLCGTLVLALQLALLSTPARSNELPAHITKLESMGLYSTPADGALGKDLWANSARSSVTNLLESMPAASSTPQINKLILGVLLTQADAGRLENDIEIESGSDLLTLRLEKLLEAGAYAQAYELYNQLEEPPYHERLARAGILAMLYNGEKSTACLETNTFMDSFGDLDFWQELAAYCTLTLTGDDNPAELEILKNSQRTVIHKLATDDSFSFPYTPESFNALSIMEQAMLASEERLDISSINQIAPGDIPNRHIQPLLRIETLDPELSFQLTARGKALGIVQPKDIYSSLFRPAHDHETDEKPLPDNDWEKLPYYLEKVENLPSDEQWPIIREALPLIDKYGPEAFLPLSTHIQHAKPDNISLGELIRCVKIIHSAGLPLNNDWINLIKEASGAEEIGEENTSTHTALLLAAYFSSVENSETEALQHSILDAAQHGQPHLAEFVNNIMKNIDNSGSTSDTLSKAYEKDFFLTYSSDYVMPSVVVWDRLAKASQMKAVGETILLSTVLLRSQPLHRIYPGLLKDILQSVENVGLTNVSRDIAITASLESIK